MPAKWKKRFKKVRKDFRNDLYIECRKNNLLAVTIICAYAAYKHRKYISKMHGWLGEKHFEIWKQYCNEGLFGKMLCGRDDVWYTLYFANRDIFNKYNGKIHEKLAQGDAYSIALRIIN